MRSDMRGCACVRGLAREFVLVNIRMHTYNVCVCMCSFVLVGFRAICPNALTRTTNARAGTHAQADSKRTYLET